MDSLEDIVETREASNVETMYSYPVALKYIEYCVSEHENSPVSNGANRKMTERRARIKYNLIK